MVQFYSLLLSLLSEYVYRSLGLLTSLKTVLGLSEQVIIIKLDRIYVD